MKTVITKEELRKIESSAVREEQKRQGFFDGRFVSRTEESKKKYTRKSKHKDKPL
jgi:hypothetical protein